MATKFDKYKKEINIFLKANYVTYPLKIVIKNPKFESHKNVTFIQEYAILEDYTVIETANAGFVVISLDMSMNNRKYDLYSKKFACSWINKENKIFNYLDGNLQFKKNNIYLQDSIEDIKSFILEQYGTTL